MFLQTPHLRFEGLYVSRNTYIRQGVAEWRREKTCHLVTYFRYFRFFPDGTLLYRTSPNTVKQVAKSLQRNPCQHGTRTAAKYEQHVHTGRYVIKVSCLGLRRVFRLWEPQHRVETAAQHPGNTIRFPSQVMTTLPARRG